MGKFWATQPYIAEASRGIWPCSWSWYLYPIQYYSPVSWCILIFIICFSSRLNMPCIQIRYIIYKTCPGYVLFYQVVLYIDQVKVKAEHSVHLPILSIFLRFFYSFTYCDEDDTVNVRFKFRVLSYCTFFLVPNFFGAFALTVFTLSAMQCSFTLWYCEKSPPCQQP